MIKARFFTVLTVIIILFSHGKGQEKKSIAKRLGYPENAKLLIIHADDIGLAQSVNEASKIAFNKKGITSGSIMVPCPWFADFADYAKKHSELDIGIHLTLTSEWKNYKWGGVSASNEIQSILDKNGYFYSSNEELVKKANPVEVEKEIRAQIERAISFGINPTHIDTHMGSMAISPEIIQLYLKMGKEYNLPVFLPADMVKANPGFSEMLGQNPVLVDNYYMINSGEYPDKWNELYNQIIMDLKPGLNQLIVHVAIDNDEMQAVTIDHPDFGSAWRQRDLDYIVSKEFKSILKKNNIYCISWKEIKIILQ